MISNLLNIAALSDSSGRNQTDLLATANNLFDSNLGTITDFRLNGSGYGGYITFDFKDGGQATLSKVEVIGRQDSSASRINGTVAQGSNDNTNGPLLRRSGEYSRLADLPINSTNPTVISALPTETTGMEIWLN